MSKTNQSVDQNIEMYMKEVGKSQEKLTELFKTIQEVSQEGITARESIMKKMQEIEAFSAQLTSLQESLEANYVKLNKQIHYRTDKINTEKKKLLTQIEQEQVTIQQLQIEAERTAKELEITQTENLGMKNQLSFNTTQSSQLSTVLGQLQASKQTVEDLKSYASQFKEIKNKHKMHYLANNKEAEIVMASVVRQEEKAFQLLQEIGVLNNLKVVLE
ncbi:hypothetical protein SS50377_23608 [Spironucleus salmonicida]|uniref:Uncharacterized protein n=1 Tax=Spironucleus salmonicida TaxID=348837 RepID=V6LVG5_9EUKA|nr:hypothetical protein SS50377_23608 [Spironucleus salmonicida]|eukprot:EST48590.1 Hypothetical protein SS50377_11201 [Spironucleus salmonicida]